MPMGVRKSTRYDRPWSNEKLTRSTTPTSSVNGSFHSVASYLNFYTNIPDYTDLHDLSDREFYSRLNVLKEAQKQFQVASPASDELDSLLAEHISSRSSLDSRHNCTKSSEDVGRRYLRTPIEATSNESHIHPPLKPPPRILVSKPSVESHCLRDDEQKSQDCGSSLLDQHWEKGNSKDTEDENILHHHHSQGHHHCFEDLSFTPPYQKHICRSMAALSLSSSGLHIHGQSMAKSKRTGKKSKHEVPLLSRIPLFDKIMAEQEERRRIIHERNMHDLQAIVQPFSFTKREEELKAVLQTCSSPDLRPHRCLRQGSHFKAKPVPKSLFSDVAYERMREDQFYRALRKRIRAEEMLKNASLPPSMEAREKLTKGKSKSLDFLDDKKCSRRRSGSRNRCYRRTKHNAGLSRDIRASSSQWSGSKVDPSSTTDSSADGSPNASTMGPTPCVRQRPRPHSALSGTRSNLASVLRMQTSRNRMAGELKRKNAEREVRDQARFKARLRRLSPAWRQLDYNTEEDLAVRLAQRREEARVRGARHRLLMDGIFGRVHTIPPLFQEPGRIQVPTPEKRSKSLDSCLDQAGNEKNRFSKRRIKSFYQDGSQLKSDESKEFCSASDSDSNEGNIA